MFNTSKTIAIFIYMKYSPQHSGSQEMEPNCIDINANFQRSKSGITSETLAVAYDARNCAQLVTI